MTSKESQISSISVGLTAGVPSGEKKREPQPKPEKLHASEPWSVLICADLGFKSNAAHRVTIAEWRDFVENHPLLLQGKVVDPFRKEPFFFEHTIRSETDFDRQAVADSIPGARELRQLAEGLGDGTVPWSDPMLVTVLQSYGASKEIVTPLQRTGKRNDSPPGGQKPSGRVDSILGMIDTGEDSGPSVVDHLGVDGDPVTVEEKQRVLDFIDRTVDLYVETVRNQVFFQSRRAGFIALKRICQAVGRSKDVQVWCYSAEGASLLDCVSRALESLPGEAGPDIVLWDYPCDFSSAYAKALERAAEAADSAKALLLSPIESSDPLIEQAPNLDSIDSLWKNTEYLPVRSLQKSEQMRTVCLCAPAAILDSDEELKVSAGWFLLSACISSILQSRFPGLSDISTGDLTGSLFGDHPRFVPSIPKRVADEASERGLCFLYEGMPLVAPEDLPVAIERSEVGESFGYAGQNLLANRVMELTTKVLQTAAGMGTRDICILLYKALSKDLQPSGIIDGDGGVEISSEEDGTIKVAVVTNVGVGGTKASVRFEFTVR